jgi:hypothetical protein
MENTRFRAEGGVSDDSESPNSSPSSTYNGPNGAIVFPHIVVVRNKCTGDDFYAEAVYKVCAFLPSFIPSFLASFLASVVSMKSPRP